MSVSDGSDRFNGVKYGLGNGEQKRYWKTDGVRLLNLPQDAFDEMASHARQNRVHGKGKFCYVPMTILANDKRTELVVTMFDKPVKQQNINAEPGDICFTLRREWNTTLCPLDD